MSKRSLTPLDRETHSGVIAAFVFLLIIWLLWKMIVIALIIAAAAACIVCLAVNLLYMPRIKKAAQVKVAPPTLLDQIKEKNVAMFESIDKFGQAKKQQSCKKKIRAIAEITRSVWRYLESNSIASIKWGPSVMEYVDTTVDICDRYLKLRTFRKNTVMDSKLEEALTQILKTVERLQAAVLADDSESLASVLEEITSTMPGLRNVYDNL